MTELLIVMLISSILTIGVVAVFMQQTRAMSLNEDFVDLEQNLRIGMDMIHRDVRMSGAYTKDLFPSFVIGPIDSNGDGTNDMNSDGGGVSPDALQMRFSETSGLEITPLGGTQFRVCSPSGLVVDQTMALSNIDGTSSIEILVKIIGPVACGAPCTVGCDKINYNPPVLPADYLGGVLWNQFKIITYYIDPNYTEGSRSFGPALMQSMGLTSPSVVAFGINNLQIDYRDVDGNLTGVLADVRRVGIELSGETRNAHTIGGGSGKRSRTMTTEILVRNLAF